MEQRSGCFLGPPGPVQSVAEHGMTGTWQAFNGTWQPFFRRTVVAIDRDVTPHAVTPTSRSTPTSGRKLACSLTRAE